MAHEIEQVLLAREPAVCHDEGRPLHEAVKLLERVFDGQNVGHIPRLGVER